MKSISRVSIEWTSRTSPLETKLLIGSRMTTLGPELVDFLMNRD